MDSGRQELEEMEEIVAYDILVEKPKVCWFPFKKAYERSMIQSEFEDKPKVYVLEGHDDPCSKSFELSLGHNDNSNSLPVESTQLVVNSNHTTRDLPINRSELYDTETNSTVTEEDDLLFGEHAMHQLAEITVKENCLSRQFWVEDLLDAGSLSCTEDFVGAGRSVTRLGRSFSTFGSHSTRQDFVGNKNEHADDLSFSRADSPMTPARIEIEYDFSREIPPSDRDIHPRSIKRVMCGVIKGKDKIRDHRATHTMTSSMSNSTYSIPKKGPSHSQSSGSVKSQVPNSQSNVVNSEMTNDRTSGSSGSASQKRDTAEIDLDNVNLPKSRILPAVLCGARARRRHHEVPIEIGDDPGDEEKKIDESMLVDPSPSVPEPLEPPDPPGQLCMKNPQFEAPWVSTMTNKFRAKTCAAPKLDWGETRIASVDDSAEPHFYVEVEATARQLNTVKDLDEIKNQEAVRKGKTAPKGRAPPVVEHARAASLVDDDSAFMERERLVDVLKRLAQKRKSHMKNESVDQTRLKEAREPVAKPLIASSFTPPRRMRHIRTSHTQHSEKMKEQATGNPDRSVHNRFSVNASVGPPSSFHQVNSIVSQGQHHVPGYREGKENVQARWSHQNTSETAWLEEIDGNDAPIEQILAQTKSSSNEADRRWSIGVRGASSSAPWSSWLPEASRSYDSHPTASSRGSDHFVPRERITVTANPAEPSLPSPDIDRVNVPDEVAIGGVTRDFELARFPSLTSSAWLNAERQQVEITRQPSEVASLRAEKDSQFRQRLDESFNTPIENNHDLMNHHASTRTSSREDWAQFNSHDDDEWLRRSFEDAVPFAVEFHNSPRRKRLDHVDHRGTRRSASRLNTAVEKPVKPANKGPAKIWIDDDESELNTEAFQKLSMDSDEDSIFYGLVDRSPSVCATSPVPPRLIEPEKAPEEIEEIEEDSFGSGNSIKKSKSTARRAIRPKQSRGQVPRVSTGLSVVSRDEITAYTAAQSVFDEPFNCMDSWLD